MDGTSSILKLKIWERKALGQERQTGHESFFVFTPADARHAAAGQSFGPELKEGWRQSWSQ